MFDNDFDKLSMSIWERILVIAGILGIFSIQAACWIWIGMKLAS